MRALTPAEAEMLRACAAPADTAILADEDGVLAGLLEAGRVTMSLEPHPVLPDYESARFDVTELGRLALRCAVHAKTVTA